MARGNNTVILGRDGPRNPEADAALLRDAEQALGLPEGVLPTTTLACREFRLAEGVSSEVAARLSRLALRHGFTPRVREKTGIKWSSERSVAPLMGVVGGVLAAWGLVSGALALSAAYVGLASAALMAVLFPLVLLTIGGVVAWWVRSIYLPLVVPVAVLPEEAPAEVFERLRAAIAEAPPQARVDLEQTHRELVAHVATLSDPAERARVHAEVARVVDDLRSTTTAVGDPTERLRRQVDDLKRVEGELERRRLEAAARAQRGSR